MNYGKFEIMVGASSRDIRSERTIRVREQKSQGQVNRDQPSEKAIERGNGKSKQEDNDKAKSNDD